MGVGHRPLMLRLYNVYIRPHIEYCSVIWNLQKAGTINTLEKILHEVTSFAIANPRYNHPAYRNFKQRLIDLQMLNIRQRLETFAIAFIIKIVKEEAKMVMTATVTASGTQRIRGSVIRPSFAITIKFYHLRVRWPSYSILSTTHPVSFSKASAISHLHNII